MKALLAAAMMVLVQQQQCDVGALVQGKTVEKFREYFPDAEVMNVIPCVLSVETHVDNVSRKLIVELAQRIFGMPEIRQLVLGMDISGYNYFVLGFTNHTPSFSIGSAGGTTCSIPQKQPGSFRRHRTFASDEIGHALDSRHRKALASRKRLQRLSALTSEGRCCRFRFF